MIVAPTPPRESARLAALHRYQILDTPSEAAFDELARLAAYVCRTPIAVISFVDSSRQWFKSVIGLPYTGSPRSLAFCAHTILGTDLFTVEEADADERFVDHPWVVAPPAVRFYAGVPLRTDDGHAIGSLAVMDVVPRALTPEQRRGLQTLANQVMAQLELRRAPRSVICQEQVRWNETEDLAQAIPDRIARHAGPASVPAFGEECSAQNTADALVRESELKFRAIFEQAPVGIATIDSITGRFRRVNSSYCRIMGYTDEELCSRTFLDITHPDDLQADLDRMTQLLGGDIATFEMEKRYFRKNGDTIWVHLTCVSLWQRPSDPRVHLALVQDISDRKRAEERTRNFQNELEQLVASRTADLQRTHRLLQSVIDSSPDWIFVKDSEHRFVLVNKAFAASQQRTPDDMAGRLDSDFWPAELCEGNAANGIRGFHADDHCALAGELIHNSYDPASLHDGTLRIFDTYKGPWRDPDGQIRGVLCYARDVTEQRRAEEIVRRLNSELAIRIDERTAELAQANRLLENDIAARKLVEARLRESHQFLASILDFLPMTVFVKDAATLRYVHFNRAGEILTGLSKEGVLGKTDHDIFPSEVADSFTAKDQAAIDACRLVDVQEEHLLTKDHVAKILRTKKVPIVDANGRPRYLLGVTEDITERTRAEEERSKQEMLLSLMLNTGPGCIKRVAADGTLLQMNPAGLKLIEACGEQDALGRSVFDLVLPEHRAAFMRMHQEVIGGAAQTLQFEIQGLRGVRRWMETHAVPFRNPGSGNTEQLAMTYDITERKRAEEALRTSQERLHLALQASCTGLWEWNTVTGEVSYSREWKSQLGYGESELPDSFETWASRLHPDDRDRATLYAQRYRDNPVGAFRQDFRLRHKDGSYRWFDSHASFVTEPDGRRIRLLGSHTDITKRKQAEDALRTSEARFRQLANAIPMLIWSADPTKACTWFNDGWLSFTGRTLEQEYGHGWAEGVHPDDFQRCLDIYGTAFDRREPFEMEYRLRHHDGTYRWLIDRGAPQYDADGGFTGYIGGCVDIQEKRDTAERLRQTEERWAYAFEGSGDGVWDWNAATNNVYFSNRWKSMLGYAPEEIGDSLEEWTSRVHPDELPAAMADVQRHFRGETPIYVNEHRVRCKDGSYKWILDRGKVISRAPDGAPLRVVGTHTDMTERKRAEEARAQAMHDLRTILETVPDVIYALDLQGRLSSWNEQMAKATGYAPAALHLKPALEMVPLEEAQRTAEAIQRAFETGYAELEGHLLTKDGRTLPYHWTGAPFTDLQGRVIGITGVGRDISERKRTEELLKFSEERFRLVAEATNDILWDWDLVTQDHWWSPNAREKFGYDPDVESSIMAWTGRLHPDDHDRVMTLVGSALASEATTVAAEYRFRLADGSYGYFYDRGQVIRDSAGRAVRMVGAMIDMTFTRRAYASLESAYQRLQEMSRELQAVETNERRRLSRELHDEVGQLLTALKFDLEAIRQALRDKTTAEDGCAYERTVRAVETTDELFVRLRRVVRALRPSVLDELGLKDALEAMVSDIQSRSDLVCSVSVEGEVVKDPIAPAIEAALYRMAQELMTNVVRHAQAMTLFVALERDTSQWILTVQDDGVGFNQKAESISGMGIRGVRERAEILGGHVDISSLPGAGTTITVWIPVPARAALGDGGNGM